MAERRPELPDLLRPQTFDRAQVERIWGAIVAERSVQGERGLGLGLGLGPGLSNRLAFAVALAAGAVAVAVAVGLPGGTLESAPETQASRSNALSLTRSDGSAFARVEAEGAQVRVALSDGSALDVKPGGLIVPIELSTRRVVLQLQRGATHFAVRPGGPRRWVIEAGPARVEVVGTRFEVARGPDGTRVRVEEGKVQVHGGGLPGGLVQLTAGEEVTVLGRAQAQAQAVATQSTATAASEPVPVSVPVSVPPVPVPEASAATAPLSSEPRRARAAPAAASKPAPAATPVPAPTAAPSIEALLAEADRLRMAREHAAAASVLERVLGEHADDPRAALAAFTLGRLREQALSDARGAADAYARALALGLRGTLAQSARAHLAHSALAAGERAQAADAARDYLARHPRGADAAAMRALLRTAGATAADAPR